MHKQFSSPHEFGTSGLQYLNVPDEQFKTVGEQLDWLFDWLLEVVGSSTFVQGP